MDFKIWLESEWNLTVIHKMVPDYVMKKIANFYIPGQKTVIIYHALKNKDDKSNDIKSGDWVTFNREYAKIHQQARKSKRILKKVVPAEDIEWAGTDENEWRYMPRHRDG